MKELVKKFIPGFIIGFYHYFLAALGAFFYGFPSRRLIVIGITGTSGKSTTAELCSLILDEAGFKTASLSSIKFKIGKKEWENKLKMTMPGRFKIQGFLRKAVRAGCKYAVLEVTSEGIKQHRHKFINFEVAVFTNLSPEHIEAHGGFKNYRKAKLQLFKKCGKTHIINLDDKNAEYFWKIPAQRKIGYRIKEKKAEIKTIGGNLGNFCFEVPKIKLLGEFNAYNSVSAVSFGLSQGISLDICQKALEKIKEIPGRMEIVIKTPFVVVVDYAHTPEALEKVYKTLKKESFGKGNLICVLGSCGGGRDKWKRPQMGRIASQYCQKVIITNEDPYNEDPAEIINQVAKGAGQRAVKILDRRRAIREALKTAGAGDRVVITGKGSEPWMCIKKGKKIPWDDRQIARQELLKLKKLT